MLGMALCGAFLFSCYTAAAQVLSDDKRSDVQDWHLVKENAQKCFPQTVPAGNYSGITHLHDDIYAVVSDKSDSALFFNFRIQINPKTGDLERVENLGFTQYVDGTLHDEKPWLGKETGFDHEAIAKVSDSMIVVASEGKCRLKEYLISPSLQQHRFWSDDGWKADDFYPNYNYESLAYDSLHSYLWTVPESTLRRDGVPATPENRVRNKLRLVRYSCLADKNDTLGVDRTEYAYLMDVPSADRKAETYVMGVSELCALPDGQLLVLEREAFIPKIKIGSFCKCKLYIVNPLQGTKINMIVNLDDHAPFLNKRLLCEWKTKLSLLDRSFANYEGMCLGPRLEDGSQTVILLSDSQDQYAGVLKDWFKTIVISGKE